MITVYTTPNCLQCAATKRALDRAGAEYRVVDLAEHSEDLEHLKALGYATAPVVIVGADSWSGFRIDKIRQHV